MGVEREVGEQEPRLARAEVRDDRLPALGAKPPEKTDPPTRVPGVQELTRHVGILPQAAPFATSPGPGRHSIRSTHRLRHAGASKGSPKYSVSRATLPSRNSMMETALMDFFPS
jgi:hypothetical protein